jgi:hypothetical protein
MRCKLHSTIIAWYTQAIVTQVIHVQFIIHVWMHLEPRIIHNHMQIDNKIQCLLSYLGKH